MVILVLGGLAESLTNFRGPLMKAMVSHGHKVVACAPGASTDVRNELRSMGIEYRHINIDRVGIDPRADIRTVVGLIKLFRDCKPDIFLGYSIKPVIYGSLAARLTGVGGIYTMIEGVGYAFMGSGVKSRAVGVIARALYRVALGYCKKVFFLNPDNLRLFQNKGLIGEEQAVMMNGIGVDLEKFSPVPFPNEMTFLMIGRFLSDKGIREYAEAARSVKKRFPEVKFILVGWIDSGNPASISAQELQSWIESGTIESLGKLQDVRPAYARSSVYVLPSYHEGVPVTVMEAMAMGRPVITTDAPGCRETVRHGGNGFLVPAKNVAALVEAIESFITHPEQMARMGAVSRRMAEERFNVHDANRVMLGAMGIG